MVLKGRLVVKSNRLITLAVLSTPSKRTKEAVDVSYADLAVPLSFDLAFSKRPK